MYGRGAATSSIMHMNFMLEFVSNAIVTELGCQLNFSIQYGLIFTRRPCRLPGGEVTLGVHCWGAANRCMSTAVLARVCPTSTMNRRMDQSPRFAFVNWTSTAYGFLAPRQKGHSTNLEFLITTALQMFSDPRLEIL